MITIIGLGPGSIDHLTRRAWEKLQSAETVYLRTSRHPCVSRLPAAVKRLSFDEVYQSVERFEDVYAEISERILAAAKRDGQVLYAVPGDPLVGEASVARIIDRARAEAIDLEIIHGLSFIEPCLSLIGHDALDGLQILDALAVAELYHPPINPALPALLAQVYSRDVASNLKLTLMNQYPDEFQVALVHAAGAPDAEVESLSLYEIDRSSKIDITTSLYLPALDELSSFESLQNIIARLRSPEGCPWDREQTHKSLRAFLIEEAYEVLDTLDAGSPAALCQELGDLLLQILLHTQIAIDEGEFYMADLLRGLNEKMLRRHPHVFGDVAPTSDLAQLSRIWNEVKAAEKAETNQQSDSLLDGVAKAAPALFVAQRYSARAAKVGFDWPDIAGVEAKFQEELAEVLAADSAEERINELGDLLFVTVNWLRWLGVDDPESLLRSINAKFYRRFKHVESQANSAGKPLGDFTLDELDSWWQDAKRLGL